MGFDLAISATAPGRMSRASEQPDGPTLQPAPAPLTPRQGKTQEELDALGEAIADLTAHIHVATYRLLLLIREFDEHEGWSGGFRTCGHWLSWRTGISRGAAREKVRVARALASLPLTSEAMQAGRLSYSKARAVTRVATPENEEELLEFARHASASQVERLVSLWRRLDRSDDAEDARLRHDRRELRVFPVDGMIEIRGRLDPEAGALLMKALSVAEDALFRESADAAEQELRPTPTQRSADALTRMAEVALEGDLSGETQGSSGDRFQVVVHVSAQAVQGAEAHAASASQPHTDGVPDSASTPLPKTASTPTPQTASTPTPKTAAMPRWWPASRPVELGFGEIEHGLSVSAETSHRVSCDCGTVWMHHDHQGTAVEVSRKTRSVPPSTRRAVWYRDRGTCQFPGCCARRCDIHHIVHWARGGTHDPDNLILLCRFHHRAVHEGGYRVDRVGGGDARFRRPDGKVLAAAPDAVRVAPRGAPFSLEHLNRLEDATPSPEAPPGWSGGRGPDYGWALASIRGRG